MDDLISREDALERLRSISADLGRRELDDAINAIENIPSSITIELSPKQIKKCLENAIVDIFPYEQQWIPCAERLPTKTGHYLCSFKKPNRIDRIHVDLAYWTGGRWYGYMGDEINAWMPLPEPYREGDNDASN